MPEMEFIDIDVDNAALLVNQNNTSNAKTPVEIINETKRKEYDYQS